MRALVISLFILFTSAITAQTISFINVYGNGGYDYGRDIEEVHDSGYVVTGSSSSFGTGEADAYLLKVDKYGEFLWSHNYGGADSDWGQSIVVTYDSTYAIGGYTNSFGAGGFDFYLIRTTGDGTPLWEKTYGGADWDLAYDLVEMPDSGFVLVGYSYSFSGNKDGYIVRTDKNGDTLWTKVIGGSGEESISEVILDGDSLVICGSTTSYGNGGTDGLISKLGIDGNTGWTKYIGSAYDDYFNSIAKNANYYIAGGVRGYDFPTAKSDMWFYKLADNGNTMIYDTTFVNFSGNDDGVNDITINPLNQDALYAGYTKSWGFLIDGMDDIFLGKISVNGESITAKNYGEAGEDVLYGIDMCKDNGYVFVGDSKYYSTGGNNIIIIRLTYLWDFPDQYVDLTFNDITTSIAEPVSEGSLNIYPNPAHETIRFNLVDEQIERVRIYSMDGQLCFADESGENTINIENLSSGTYLLEVKTEEGSYTSRIIKN